MDVKTLRPPSAMDTPKHQDTEDWENSISERSRERNGEKKDGGRVRKGGEGGEEEQPGSHD